MIKAIIFDMDGLMIDSERCTYEAYVKECAKYGYKMDLAYYKSLIGYNMGIIRTRLVSHFGKDFPLETVIQNVFNDLKERFETEGVPLKKGLLGLLEYAKCKGYKIVAATSSDRNRVDHILKLADIAAYFDASVCGNEIKNSKPNPEIFLTACEKIAVKPEDTLVLEDSEWGILAAFNAGIRCICIPDMKRPQKQFSEKTVAVLESLEQVIPFLDKEARESKK